MSHTISTKKRIGLILLVLIIMTITVVMVGQRIRHSHHKQEYAAYKTKPMSLLKTDDKKEAISFTTPASFQLPEGIKQRLLTETYKLRAYPGAPPSIPHPVLNEQEQNCNVCHKKGGLVPKYNAFAPVTPHPDYENCLQCHALNKSSGEAFTGIDWLKVKAPPLKRSALPGSPPPIPHTMQLRDNCAACHTGPSAPLEIRCGHPERINCIQCHVPQKVPGVFTRNLEREK
jgi:nitrate reductase (cytochrome), electron transfer subunit